jgi:hypothetical protein
MRLSSWSVWLEYEFDPDSGQYSREFVRYPAAGRRPISGQAALERTPEPLTLADAPGWGGWTDGARADQTRVAADRAVPRR